MRFSIILEAVYKDCEERWETADAAVFVLSSLKASFPDTPAAMAVMPALIPDMYTEILFDSPLGCLPDEVYEHIHRCIAKYDTDCGEKQISLFRDEEENFVIVFSCPYGQIGSFFEVTLTRCGYEKILQTGLYSCSEVTLHIPSPKNSFADTYMTSYELVRMICSEQPLMQDALTSRIYQEPLLPGIMIIDVGNEIRELIASAVEENGDQPILCENIRFALAYCLTCMMFRAHRYSLSCAAGLWFLGHGEKFSSFTPQQEILHIIYSILRISAIDDFDNAQKMDVPVEGRDFHSRRLNDFLAEGFFCPGEYV